MASGLALAFGVMRVINVAQGALIILGAYLSYSLYGHLGIDPFVGLLILTPAMFVLGVLVQLTFLRPLRDEEREEFSLLVTWAIALGIEGLLSVFYQTTYRSTITGYADHSWHVLGYYFSVVRCYAFIASMIVLGLLFAILKLTRLGRAIRATVQNPTAARLLGVETNRISALGFGLSVATASAAGAVYGMVFPFTPGSHYDLISRLLTIVVLGGIGSLGGAVIAALAMGIVSSIVAALLAPIWSDFSFFVVLLLVLLLRPRGLFGARVRGAL